MSIVALIFGIFALALSVFPGINGVGAFMGVLTLVWGTAGIGGNKTGLAIASVVLNAIMGNRIFAFITNISTRF